jgi:hypothetical protein
MLKARISFLLVFVLCVVLALAACSTTSAPNAGNGPIAIKFDRQAALRGVNALLAERGTARVGEVPSLDAAAATIADAYLTTGRQGALPEGAAVVSYAPDDRSLNDALTSWTTAVRKGTRLPAPITKAGFAAMSQAGRTVWVLILG